MQKDHSYGIIAFFENSNGEREFLLINQKSDNGSFWGYPKGHPELGENGLQAAKREFLEEVGIKDVEIIGDKTIDTDYIFPTQGGDTIQKTVTFRIGKVKDKDVKIQEEELNGYKRADFSSAMNLLTHKNYKNILENVVKYLENIK